MSEEKKAVVHDDELAAIKDSRKRDMLLFRSVNSDECMRWNLLLDVYKLAVEDTDLHKRIERAIDTGCDTVWIVAVSEHQAKLALVDHIWPMDKLTKRDCETRYIELLESAAEKGSSNGET